MAKILKQAVRRKASRRVDTSESSGRFPLDALLRLWRFRLLERRGKADPIWTRGGRRFSQEQALRMIPAGKVARARAAEQARWGQDEGECSGR